MSRGEETDEPITGDDRAAPEEPASPHFEVVISGDGSATIEGEPVRLEEGATLDAAILDTLHGHARDRNTAVTADISDPSVGYVAYVEVAPDGSSRLLEEHRDHPLHEVRPQADQPQADDEEHDGEEHEP
ncbi:hypothetical protein, partial [Streptomyces olivochromogenes]|uniref:hypothetical protein n=1 Tax=Streptomyces olivochromogenes TaxID=1963 RepID=UPI0035AE3813|nr:hypothetical protein [Streptomyces olivochromogenes]